MTLQEAIAYLEGVITKNKVHKNYKRVNQLAQLYQVFYTGDGIAEELEKMYRIKIPEKLINSVIPPILKSTMFPFQKVARAKPVMRKIDYNEKEYENKKTELESFINKYWYGKSLEKYMKHVLIEMLYVDPNAWIVTEFKEFDPLREKARPYPFLVTCSEAIDFAYNGGTLKYLIVKQETTSKTSRFTMYLGDYTVVYDEVLDGGVTTLANGKKYNINTYNPKGKKVPAIRVGFIYDIETRGETFLSVFDKVIPFIYKQLKIDFEGDSSMADLAFPKRSLYVDNCPVCIGGRKPDGSGCTECDGTGRAKTHRTTSDVREFAMPRDPAEIIDLSKLSYTENPPVEGLRFQQEYKNLLKQQIFSFMFNAEFFSKTEVSATATEQNIHRDNLNDALYPFSQHFSEVWVYLVETIAMFTDLDENLILEHILPEDFKFKNIQELMLDLKAAKDANASSSTITAIEEDVLELLYSDRPEELKKLRIKNSFNPFSGTNEMTVNTIFSTSKTTEFNMVLWANLEAIFKELERESTTVYLYDLNYLKIWELVHKKVEEYISKLPKPEVTPIDFTSDLPNGDGTDDDDNDDKGDEGKTIPPADPVIPDEE